MRSCKKWKLLLFSLVTFLGSTPVFSQAMFQPRPSQSTKMAAREAVEQWDKQLGLRAKQASLMEQKIIEYEIKRNKLLQQDFPEGVKLKHLATLNALEITEMRNILTKPQYDWYIYLLKRGKPGATVAGNR